MGKSVFGFIRTWVALVALALVSAVAFGCSGSGSDGVVAATSNEPAAAPQQPAAASGPAASTDTTAASQQPDAAVQPAAARAVVSAVPSKAKINRVVVGLTPPAAEGNATSRALGSPDMWQLRPMYEHLILVDPVTGHYTPGLATEWSLEPSGTAFRFKLRKGVQFHSGWGEFTAKDVVFTHWDTVHEDAQHGSAPSMRKMTKEIEIINDYEVVWHIGSPDASLIAHISEAIGAYEMTSKKHYDDVGKSPSIMDAPIAGTGPYQFKERVQTSYVRYERIPYTHWRVPADFQEFEFRFISEASTRVAALITEELHATIVPTDDLEVVKQRGMNVLTGGYAANQVFLSYLCCYMDKETSSGFKYPESPLANVKVRQAMNKAINRDELNQAFFQGKGKIVYAPHINEAREGWNPEWIKRFPAEYGYDPAAAKALLAEAGYGKDNPVQTNMIMNDLTSVPGSLDIQDAVAGYLKDVGIEVKQLTMDAGKRRAGYRSYKWNNHLSMTTCGADLLICYRVYNSSLPPRVGFEHPELQELFLKSRAILDQKARSAAVQKVGDKAFEIHAALNLFWLPSELVVNPKYISEYKFPGPLSGTFTHVWNMKATVD